MQHLFIAFALLALELAGVPTPAPAAPCPPYGPNFTPAAADLAWNPATGDLWATPLRFRAQGYHNPCPGVALSTRSCDGGQGVVRGWVSLLEEGGDIAFTPGPGWTVVSFYNYPPGCLGAHDYELALLATPETAAAFARWANGGPAPVSYLGRVTHGSFGAPTTCTTGCRHAEFRVLNVEAPSGSGRWLRLAARAHTVTGKPASVETRPWSAVKELYRVP